MRRRFWNLRFLQVRELTSLREDGERTVRRRPQRTQNDEAGHDDSEYEGERATASASKAPIAQLRQHVQEEASSCQLMDTEGDRADEDSHNCLRQLALCSRQD